MENEYKSPIGRLIAVQRFLPYLDGWRCIGLTKKKVIMYHPVHGRKVCKVFGPKIVHVSGGLPPKDDKNE